MNLTADQVAQLAPDSASVDAARKLAQPRHWTSLGRDAAALWGQCQGSALYQARADLSDLTCNCSCPSRKLPCKHSLALLLLAANQPDLFAEDARPEWVTSWLAKRDQSAARRATRTEKANKPVDAAAQAKRARQRVDRVAQGLEALDLWMADLVRQGLASVETQGLAPWHEQARRLVDAQAPGLAARVHALAEIPRATRDWPERLLGELGKIALLTHAFRRLDQLPPGLQDDLRQQLGFARKEDDVAAAGERVDDDWLVLGQLVEVDERFATQRTWLRGQGSGRVALVLQFSVGGAPVHESFVPGTRFGGTLCFWPSAAPERALVHERRTSPETWTGTSLGGGSIEDFLVRTAAVLAAQPWQARFPAVLRGVVPLRARDAWHVLDEGAHSLPLAGSDHLRLLALSGGHPVDLAGEWDGERLTPLSLVSQDGFARLGEARA